MTDVRNHLVAMLEELGDTAADEKTVARAKATAEVSREYTATVKVEIDARRLAGVEQIPDVLEGAPLLPGRRD